eukprot:TRINITY_DN56233_c0_g1_i1.p1 TRINITY_DN56233_c0_g1~~TRINITY_DN56233_c0_g1_i1.p1  ORF type:complete len:618 (+),score=54.39 TRINITY_DN56233_c0_g1_i1:196-2049(+)
MAILVRVLLLLVPISAQDLFITDAESQGSFLARKPLETTVFRVSHDKTFGGAFTGRIRVHVGTKSEDSPSELLFGKDVFDWIGTPIAFSPGDATVRGFPASLDSFVDRMRSDQTIYVQAELVVYDLFNRTGLPPTWLPVSCVSKAGQNGVYAKPDGTLLSRVVKGRLSDGIIDISLVDQVPDSTPKSPGCAGLGDAVDSEWVKTVRINSSLLSTFWNRPIELEACVLLPMGFDTHPDAKYPLVVAHGHYSPQFFPGGGFQERKPTCDRLADYACYSQHDAYELYSKWKDPEGPFRGARTLVMTINHPVPFFDDSYAVNTANMGPYGDAIVRELIPEVERRFRGIGQGWARGLFGGSTGGWETVAQQVVYPDEFNGILAACPDPVTFTSYVTANIYEAQNYFFYDDAWLRRARPAQRDHYSGQAFQAGYGPAFVDAYGEVTQTLEEANHQELAMGTHSRSCGQWDIWEATFSPACEDGFPCRLYDKETGKINKTVAAYWREHYDLAHIIERDWANLEPKLKGKLNIAVGGSDTFYLTNAVLDLRKVLHKLGSDANVTVGAHDGVGYQHCFNGYMYDEHGKALPNSVTRNHYLQMNIPDFARRWVQSAPSGADTSSWRY